MRFEIHVTVITSDIEKFKRDCNDLNVKPIVIETPDSSTQVMTSATYKDNDYPATLQNLTTSLKSLGYNIIRAKVEKQPEDNQDPRFIYYESHIRLKLPKDYDKSFIKDLCQAKSFHMSRNLFKKDLNWDYQMITFRTYDMPLNGFKMVIDDMAQTLDGLGINFDKIEIEECIYDSNTHVDDAWLKKDLAV
jgi:hypothetical protein